MGYPRISNPSEKISIEQITTCKLEGGSYRISAMVNNSFDMRDVGITDKQRAIDSFKEDCQFWAKYYPNYEEL